MKKKLIAVLTALSTLLLTIVALASCSANISATDLLATSTLSNPLGE